MIEKGENKEYLPIQGLDSFRKATVDLLLGDSPAVKEVYFFHCNDHCTALAGRFQSFFLGAVVLEHQVKATVLLTFPILRVYVSMPFTLWTLLCAFCPETCWLENLAQSERTISMVTQRQATSLIYSSQKRASLPFDC